MRFFWPNFPSDENPVKIGVYIQKGDVILGVYSGNYGKVKTSCALAASFRLTHLGELLLMYLHRS